MAPIRRNTLEESKAEIRPNCHSGVASFKGKELKMIALRLNPMINQPIVAIAKAVFAVKRVGASTKLDSAAGSTSLAGISVVDPVMLKDFITCPR